MEERRGKRRRRNEDEIAAHVAAWSASDQSVADFAREQGLPSSSLYQWIQARGGLEQVGKGRPRSKRGRRRGGRGDTVEPMARLATTDFAEVTVVQERQSGTEVTIMMAAGHTITLEGVIDRGLLETVLEAVKAC